MFDFLTGTKRPASGTPVLSSAEVRARLLQLNRVSAPWQIHEASEPGVDLIAEWKIVDAQWYEVFAKAGLTKVFQIHLRLDDANHHVRAVDKEYTVEWRAGIPALSLAASAFRGQSTSVEFGEAYGFTEELTPGQLYKYRFRTSEIKQPLQQAVIACGWVYKGVVFGKV